MDEGSHFLASVRDALANQKGLAERAMEQLQDADLHWSPHSESNNIAIIVKHLAGNMRSRWSDFLTTDGEKPNRNRDGEFVDDIDSREELMRRWEDGWQVLFDTLASLDPSQLQQTVTVGGRRYSVIEAILGQLGHYAQHVGQIVYLAKLRLADEWETLSIPKRRRGSSAGG